MVMRPAPLALALVLLLPLPAAAGPFRLDDVGGSVVDEDTGEPIAGALVVEWWKGRGRLGAPAPAVHARFATSDAAGRFVLAGGLTPPRLWLAHVHGPVHGFVHPSYGLETASPRELPGESDALLLQGSLRRSHLRLAALREYCTGRHDEEAGAERIVAAACPLEAHAAWPTGVPRAEGPRDERGRRTGTWTFRRADGSVAARGAYRAGGALGDWSFFDPEGNPVGKPTGGTGSAPPPIDESR
jgi:hypothetical protein